MGKQNILKLLALFKTPGSGKVIWQLIKFSLVGVSNTAVYLAIYYLFVWLNPNWYMAGSIIGTIISIANAFVWNERYVFTGNDKNCVNRLRRLFKTYISYGGTSILSNVLLWLEVAVLQIGRNVAPIVNLLVTIPLNFVINKFWTFKN